MKTKFYMLIASLLITFTAAGTSVTVPGNFSTIQEAVDASVSGDTIVVTPGTYYENINFRGKNIVLTSLWYQNADTSYISSTILHGGNPVHPDTGSCVVFNSGEDSTAVLQGFTITGGTGSKWFDIHGAGMYREGGGILVELSSPTIRFNIITNNCITNLSGVVSTGGGGIRVGDGSPVITNNVIMNNQARYGAGIVLNYTGCTLRNNVIAGNSGGQDYYGGSGIWILNNLPGKEKIIENNTIVNNQSSASNGTGGVSVWSASNVILKNNILYGNLPGLQIKTISSAPQVTYSNVEGGYAGIGNVDADPLLSGAYLLASSSPCVDAGDMMMDYDDVEDLNNPGNALSPSQGLLRNDIGAYGGPGAAWLPVPSAPVGIQQPADAASVSWYPNPASSELNLVTDSDFRHASIRIFDRTGKQVIERIGDSGSFFQLRVNGLTPGLYFLVVEDPETHRFHSGTFQIR